MSEVLARAARDADGLPQPADLAVPTHLTAIIDHYIAKLGIEQRALLSAAAVCGVEFRVSTVSHALDRDGAWVGEACEELARERLWLRGPRAQEVTHACEPPYSFRHTLFRQVLYERTAPLARAQLHRKVHAALEKERAAGVPVTAAELHLHACKPHGGMDVEPSEDPAGPDCEALSETSTFPLHLPGRGCEDGPVGRTWLSVDGPGQQGDLVLDPRRASVVGISSKDLY
jgi:hypothetical protein